jgi:hypothetical protein
MERDDNRHSQFAQECQYVTTSRPAENTELMLQADNVYVADVEEVRGTQIGRQVLLLNLEANDLRGFVAISNVIHRHRETLALGMGSCDGREQVRRERGNATLARQVIANEGDFSNSRAFFHKRFQAWTQANQLSN